MSSSYNHPSCAMGCAFGKVTSSVLACKSACHTADNKCTWTLKNLSGNNCVNCPHGCDASDGVQECLQGCEFAHGEYDGNIWVTDVPEDVYIDGLMSVEPHARYMRARWPNPRTGTQEFRPFANVQVHTTVLGRKPWKIKS